MKIRRYPAAALASPKFHLSALAGAAVRKESGIRTFLAVNGQRFPDDVLRIYRHRLANAERRTRVYYRLAAACPSSWAGPLTGARQ